MLEPSINPHTQKGLFSILPASVYNKITIYLEEIASGRGTQFDEVQIQGKRKKNHKIPLQQASKRSQIKQ